MGGKRSGNVFLYAWGRDPVLFLHYHGPYKDHIQGRTGQVGGRRAVVSAVSSLVGLSRTSHPTLSKAEPKAKARL